MKNHEPLKIAICGEVRSGKDTVGKILEEELVLMPFAFADELKKDFHRENPHIRKAPKPRKCYQLFGELKRATHGEDYWITKLFHKIEETKHLAEKWLSTCVGVYYKPFNVLVTDTHYGNEARSLRENGFTLIRIVAPLEVRKERMIAEGDNFKEEDLHHVSETEVNSFEVDYEIVNDGTLEELYAKVEELITNIRADHEIKEAVAELREEK